MNLQVGPKPQANQERWESVHHFVGRRDLGFRAYEGLATIRFTVCKLRILEGLVSLELFREFRDAAYERNPVQASKKCRHLGTPLNGLGFRV